MAKKKLKKFLKSAAKAALIGGALYGGSKLLKSRGLKRNINAANMENANVGINTRPGLIDAQDAGSKFKFRHKPINPNFNLLGAAKGGRIGAKSGGRVKSMGIAKRGGGVAKR
jgi:hypothetical protein